MCGGLSVRQLKDSKVNGHATHKGEPLQCLSQPWTQHPAWQPWFFSDVRPQVWIPPCFHVRFLYIYITEESYLMYCNVMYVCLFEESISCMYGLSIGITSCCMLLPLQQRMHVHSWCCQAPKINNTAFFWACRTVNLLRLSSWPHIHCKTKTFNHNYSNPGPSCVLSWAMN